MKIQSLLLASLLAPLCAAAQTQPAASAAAAPQATMADKAEALSEEQIKQSHDIPALSKLAQLYNAKGDLQRFTWTLERVAALMPNAGDLKLQLAMAYAKSEDKTRAYDTLLHMQAQGFGYDISKDPRFDPIHDTKVWEYVVANLAVNARQFGEGKVAFELPRGDHLFNALAWDAKRKQLLVGSQRDGSVQLADDAGKLSDFIKADASNGLWGVDALATDNAHGKLYVASAASPRYKGFNADNAGRAGIFEFELASGKLKKKYLLPVSEGAHVLTSLALGKDGSLYAADGTNRIVFKLEGDALKPILKNPRLTGITGLALSGDGRTLYLADYAMGVFGYDLAKSAAFGLGYNPASLVLGGIDSLTWYDGTLVAVEGGMVPKRVMRLKLSEDGRSVASAMPLDVAQPAFDALGQAAVAGDNLYFVTNRQDALYDSHGVLTNAADLEPTDVFRSNLRFAWGQNGVSTGGRMLTVGPDGTAQSIDTSEPPTPGPLPPKKAEAKKKP